MVLTLGCSALLIVTSHSHTGRFEFIRWPVHRPQEAACVAQHHEQRDCCCWCSVCRARTLVSHVSAPSQLDHLDLDFLHEKMLQTDRRKRRGRADVFSTTLEPRRPSTSAAASVAAAARVKAHPAAVGDDEDLEVAADSAEGKSDGEAGDSVVEWQALTSMLQITSCLVLAHRIHFLDKSPDTSDATKRAQRTRIDALRRLFRTAHTNEEQLGKWDAEGGFSLEEGTHGAVSKRSMLITSARGISILCSPWGPELRR